MCSTDRPQTVKYPFEDWTLRWPRITIKGRKQPRSADRGFQESDSCLTSETTYDYEIEFWVYGNNAKKMLRFWFQVLSDKIHHLSWIWYIFMRFIMVNRGYSRSFVVIRGQMWTTVVKFVLLERNILVLVQNPDRPNLFWFGPIFQKEDNHIY